MKHWSFLTSPPVQAHPAFVHGFLAVLLLLLGWNVWLVRSFAEPAPSSRYGSLVVSLMLLCNHLAFQFRWPAPVMAALRILAMTGSVLGLIYVWHGLHSA